MNTYAYAGGNPISNSDPSGLYFGWDDAFFTVGGALFGVAGQGLNDLASGNLSSWQDYLSAGVGGAVGGEALLYTGPIGAGAAGALAGNVTKQTLNVLFGKQCYFNPGSALTDTTVGAIGGYLSGWAISGVNAGRGSFNSIYKQIVTKAQNGTISSITATTAAKMFAGRNWIVSRIVV